MIHGKVYTTTFTPSIGTQMECGYQNMRLKQRMEISGSGRKTTCPCPLPNSRRLQEIRVTPITGSTIRPTLQLENPPLVRVEVGTVHMPLSQTLQKSEVSKG